LKLFRKLLFCVLALALVACGKVGNKDGTVLAGIGPQGDGHGYGGTRPNNPGEGTKPIDSGRIENGTAPIEVDPIPSPEVKAPVAVSPGGAITIDGSKKRADGCEIQSCMLICYAGNGISVSPAPSCNNN